MRDVFTNKKWCDTTTDRTVKIYGEVNLKRYTNNPLTCGGRHPFNIITEEIYND